MRTILAVLMLTALAVGGCTHNVTELAGDEAYQRTGTHSIGRMDNDGTLQTAYSGLGATGYQVDDVGVWGYGPGRQTVAQFSFGDVTAVIASPKDGTLEDVKMDPSTGEISIGTMSWDVSTPIEAATPAVVSSLERLEGMTATEAAATVEKWRAAGEIAPTAADVLLAVIGAAFPPG